MQSLRERHTHQMKPVRGEISREPFIGEVVLIKEELRPRGSWQLGKVEKLLTSESDGLTRAVVLTTSAGKVLKRPLKLLYPLECYTDVDDAIQGGSNSKLVPAASNQSHDDRPVGHVHVNMTKRGQSKKMTKSENVLELFYICQL